MAVGWAIGAGYGSQGAHLIKVWRARRDPRVKSHPNVSVGIRGS
jgi:hypothetical protein